MATKQASTRGIPASKVQSPQKPKAKPVKQDDETRHRIEANIKETHILATISQLQTQIGEWFEVAPKDMHEGFDKRLRRQIGSLID